MNWTEQDHPRDEDGRFTYKNGATSNSNTSNEDTPSILYQNTKKQKDEEQKIQKKKNELLEILGDKASAADVLYADTDTLEKKIEELGLRKKEVSIDNLDKSNNSDKNNKPPEVKLLGKIPTEKKSQEQNTQQIKQEDKIRTQNNTQTSLQDLKSDIAPLKGHIEYNDDRDYANINKNADNPIKNNIQDENFNKMMKHIYVTEGGFSDNKNDMGGRTNKGVTQRTFDAYNKKMNRPIKDVKYITKDEADEIYYKEYYLASGANKIKDKNLRYLHYDAAINHGVGRANKFLEESGGDFDKYMKLRRNKYDDIVNDKPKQKVFYKGWINRLNKIQEMKDKNILDD